MRSISTVFWRFVASMAAVIYANRAEPALWLIGVIAIELVVLLVLTNASIFL